MQTIDFISTEPSLFHSLITFGPDEPEVVLSAMHARRSSATRPHFWNRLAQDPPPSSVLWLVMGDLNTVTSDKEKSGGRPIRLAHCTTFSNFVNTTSPIDLGFSGSLYTWDNGCPGVNRIQERLDRVLTNPTLLQLYPHTQVTHLPKLYSDHCPILVDLCPNRPL